MKSFDLTYKPFGQHSILIEWPQVIDENILNDVLRFKSVLEKHYLKENVYIKLAYNSILVSYDFTIRNIYDKILELKQHYSLRQSINKDVFKLWRIPVCYDERFGIDLEEMSQVLELPKSQIIHLHCNPKYTVYFIGFLPGFLYLGGLHDKLCFPRKEMPRMTIEKGAVAIGGNQTGIYPKVSPGGWNIIGNSPIKFFDVMKEVPCFAKPGDQVRFYSITPEEHKDIYTLVEAGVYQLECEVIRD